MASYARQKLTDPRSYILAELASARANGSATANDLVNKLRQTVPIEGYSFAGLDIDGYELGKSIHFATNLPEAFLRAYDTERLFEIDPLRGLVSESSPVARWDRLDPEVLTRPATRRLVAALDTYGIAPRTVVALYRSGKPYGGVTFTRREPFSEAETFVLQMVAPTLHNQLCKAVFAFVNSHLGLNSGEIQCLQLAAKGITTEQIAVHTPFTVETVGTYIKSATKKLSAGNRTEAVALALRRRIIN